MTLINLYRVTNTLLNLLALNVSVILNEERNEVVPIPRPDLTVTAMAPEQVENANNTLNFFLYHVTEDPYYKNVLGPGSDIPNVAKIPMALSMFYILTTHHEVDPEFDAQTQQNLMGYALKTFHDFPVITDQTEIANIPVLDEGLRGNGNNIQTILRPVSAEDAITFWSSEDTRTARLSAYYEVRVVMLEPEPPQTLAGLVLNLGTFVVQIGSPHLENSQSIVRFQIPAIYGGTIQEATASPARVTLDNSSDPPDAHNNLQLLGTNLAVGRSRTLILKNSLWANLESPDLQVEQAVIDLGINPNWQIEVTPNQINLQIASTLAFRLPDQTTVDLPVLPGFYSVFVRSVKDELVINNQLKQVVTTSKETAFLVAPRILGHEDPDGDGNIQVNLGPEFDLLDQNFAEEAMQVVVSGEVYTRTDTDPPENEREFAITNTPNNLIRINPDFPVTVGESAAIPFRLTVNGAESAPFWIELNP